MVPRNRGQLGAVDRTLCCGRLRHWVDRGDAALQDAERNSRIEVTELSQDHDRRRLDAQTFSDRAAIPGRSRTRSWRRKTQRKIALTLRRGGPLKRIAASRFFAAKRFLEDAAVR